MSSCFKKSISVISTAFSCIKGISSPTKLLRLRVNIYRVSKSHAIVPYVFCMTMITWVYQGQKGFLFWFAFKPSFLYTHGKLLSFVIKSEANFRRKNITKYVRHHVGYTSTTCLPSLQRALYSSINSSAVAPTPMVGLFQSAFVRINSNCKEGNYIPSPICFTNYVCPSLGHSCKENLQFNLKG